MSPLITSKDARLNIRLADDELDLWHRHAELVGLTLSDLVRRVMAEYLANFNAPPSRK